MEKQKVILMIANSGTAANGFLAFAERLEGRSDIKFIMVCHPRVQIDVVREKGIALGNPDLVILDFDEEQRGKKSEQGSRDYKYVKDKLYISLIKAVFNTVKIVTENKKGLRKAKKIIKSEKPDIVLLYADNKSELEKFFIYHARKQGIKTVIAPICLSDIEGILLNPTNGFRIKKDAVLPLTAKIIKRINPKIERPYQDQTVFFGQPFIELMNYLMGFFVPNPWVQGSLADIVCTAYPEQYDEIVRELGQESVEGRLFLTESVEDGIIIEGYKNRELIKKKLSEKYHFRAKPTVIIAFSERVQQWSRENDLYNKGIIVQSVLQYYDEVLVSLHPKSDLKENQFLEEYTGCHIVEEPLRKIIGAADLIIYADISSISRWVEWLQLNRVTYDSYSIQEKWSEDLISEFKTKLADSKEAVQGEEHSELSRGIDFTEFVLDLL